MEWENDKRWSDRFLPEIKSVCGSLLIEEASVETDQRENTDLIVLRLGETRIACRVRRYSHLAKYGNQFTVRVARPTGARTELSKIMEGWGDYIFYGFESFCGAKLSRWLLGDLKVFRLWHFEQMRKNKVMPGELVRNRDGTSFRSYLISQLPSEFLFATFDCTRHHSRKDGLNHGTIQAAD